MTRKPSPELIRRADRLDGCRGSWILDCRDNLNRGYDLHHLPAMGCRTAAEALAYCAEDAWKDCRLLFCADHLNGDDGYGYTAPTYYTSNERVFRAEFAKELENADGDGPGLSIDIRYITNEMIEAIESLENYPIIDENDHSDLEMERQAEEWENWAATEWRDAVTAALYEYAPEDQGDWWGEETLDAVPGIEDKLEELFSACCDQSNTYWEEQSGSGFYINIKRAAEAIDRTDLADLTGLPLLAPEQEWRREPYPWPGAEPSPLIPPMVTAEAGR